MGEDQAPTRQAALAAGIVAAYVSNNSVPAADLPPLIQFIYASLLKAASAVIVRPAGPPKEPALPIKKSVGNDYIICLEDGKKFRTLKRHLFSKYDMTPAQYRAKWALPHDYPMVAPGYAAQRSDLAKQIGLGFSRKGATAKKQGRK